VAAALRPPFSGVSTCTASSDAGGPSVVVHAEPLRCLLHHGTPAHTACDTVEADFTVRKATQCASWVVAEGACPGCAAAVAQVPRSSQRLLLLLHLTAASLSVVPWALLHHSVTPWLLAHPVVDMRPEGWAQKFDTLYWREGFLLAAVASSLLMLTGAAMAVGELRGCANRRPSVLTSCRCRSSIGVKPLQQALLVESVPPGGL
jgi:hypothetical protein